MRTRTSTRCRWRGPMAATSRCSWGCRFAIGAISRTSCARCTGFRTYGASSARGRSAEKRSDAFAGKHLLQLARLVHLAHDVAAADEFAADVKLRDRRPLRVVLDPLAQLVV